MRCFTLITKQPRRAQFTTNYRTAEDGMFYIDYKIVRLTTNSTVAEVYLRRS